MQQLQLPHMRPQGQLTQAATATSALLCSMSKTAPLARTMPPAPSVFEGSQPLPLQQGAITSSSSTPHQQQQHAGQAPAEPDAGLHPHSSLLVQHPQLHLGSLRPVMGAASWYLAVFKAAFTQEELQAAVGEFGRGVTGGALDHPVLESCCSISRGWVFALLGCCELPGAADAHAATTQLRPLAADVCVALLLEHADKQASSSVPCVPGVQQFLLPISSDSSNLGSNNPGSSNPGHSNGSSSGEASSQQKQKLPGVQQQRQHRVSWCPLGLEHPHKVLPEPSEAQLQQLVPIAGTKVLKIRVDWKRGNKKEVEQRLWEAAAAMYLFQQQVQGGVKGWDGGPKWAALKQCVQVHAPTAREAASLLASELGAMPGRLVSEMQCSE
jgi:hypothetical protein